MDIIIALEAATPYIGNTLDKIASLTPRLAIDMGTLCKINITAHNHA